MKKYSDILAKAIDPETYPDPEDLWETDHGYLTDDDAMALVNRRLEEQFKTESYVRQLDNGEIWQYNPDGTKIMVRDSKGLSVEND